MTLNRGRRTAGRRTLGVLAAAALAAAGTWAAGPAAQAAPAPGTALAPHLATSRTFTIPAGTDTYVASVGSAQATITRAPGRSAADISCELNIFNPFRYYGGPYGGGVEGLANIQCNNVVQQIDVTVGLYKNSNLVSYRTRTAYSTTQAVADTEYPYSSGYYETGALGTVYFPSGYTPPTGSIPQSNSPVVYIP